MEKITIDFKKTHPFAQYGATNGPWPTKRTGPGEELYRQLNFTWSRLHDTGLLGLHRYVDIDKIFPDFNLDENNPDNYHFADTDRFVNKLVALNKKIIFRLGYSAVITKHYKNKVPASIDKWARIACNIAKRYSDRVEYFEIWNEPDLKIFFEGSLEQFCEIYAKTATLMKEEIEGVRIGGCGFADGTGEFARGFLSYVKAHHLPLDFYSYHRYHHVPSEYRRLGFEVRKMLDQYGFKKCITILDEWNFNINFNRQLNASYRAIQTNQGAMFTLATLIEIAKTPIDINTYYDFQVSYMLFFYNGLLKLGFPLTLKKTRTYEAYSMFNIVRTVGEYYDCPASAKGLYAIACKKENILYVLMVNYRFMDNRDMDVEVDLNGLDYQKVLVVGSEGVCEMKHVDHFELKDESYILIKYYL